MVLHFKHIPPISCSHYAHGCAAFFLKNYSKHLLSGPSLLLYPPHSSQGELLFSKIHFASYSPALKPSVVSHNAFLKNLDCTWHTRDPSDVGSTYLSCLHLTLSPGWSPFSSSKKIHYLLSQDLHTCSSFPSWNILHSSSHPAGSSSVRLQLTCPTTHRRAHSGSPVSSC